MKLLFTVFVVALIGAILSLLLRFAFPHPGAWYWWAIGGAVVALVVGVGWILWDLEKGGNVIASWALVLAVAVMAAVPTRSWADDFLYVSSGVTVRLAPKPCPNPKLAKMLELDSVTPPMVAIVKWPGEGEYLGCWALASQFMVNVIDERARRVGVPVSRLKLKPDA